MATYKLIIYIDETLINSSPVQVGNLVFARVVNGESNVVFQSKGTKDLSAVNILSWKQSYQISATQDLKEGAMITAGTSMRNIAADTICDWTPKEGEVIRNMPNATKAPLGWKPLGSFGTLNMPKEWKNQIWCATGTGAYSCIFADVNPIPGETHRSYLVENNYQLNWSTELKSASVLYTSWSDAYTVEYGPRETVKWVSWGYEVAGEGEPRWFVYASDPSAHNPAKEVIIKENSSGGPVKPHSYGIPVHFEYNYADDAMLSSIGAKSCAKNLGLFLESSSPQYLNCSVDSIFPKTSVTARLDLLSPCYDLLHGDTALEKTICAVQSLMKGLSVKYLPFSETISFRSRQTLPTPDPGSNSDDELEGKRGVGKIYRYFKGKLTWTGGLGRQNWGDIASMINQYFAANTNFVMDQPTFGGGNITMLLPFKTAPGGEVGTDIADQAWNMAYSKLEQNLRTQLTNDGAEVDASPPADNPQPKGYSNGFNGI